jgi:hypothetical protein
VPGFFFQSGLAAPGLINAPLGDRFTVPVMGFASVITEGQLEYLDGN